MDASLDQRLRTLRILHLVFLSTILLYAVVGEMVPHELQDVGVFHKALIVVLVFQIGLITVFRTRWIAPQVELLERDRNDAAALQRWHGGHIACYALAESVALLGLVLRFLGGTFVQAAPFYAVGFVLLAFLAPRNPGQ